MAKRLPQNRRGSGSGDRAAVMVAVRRRFVDHDEHQHARIGCRCSAQERADIFRLGIAARLGVEFLSGPRFAEDRVAG